MLNVQTDTVLDEMKGAVKLLEKWIAHFEQGLPVIDAPGSEEQLETLMRECCGELKIVAGKCANLSEVLLGD